MLDQLCCIGKSISLSSLSKVIRILNALETLIVCIFLCTILDYKCVLHTQCLFSSDRVKDVLHVQRLHQRFQTLKPSTSSQEEKPGFRFDPYREGDVSEDEMNELDENGWAHVHHAAFRGFVKSVERFVKAAGDQLELETGDDLKSTPLLLAVMSGQLETVECLVELGARLSAINTQNHGVVELCAFKQFLPILEYFVELGREELPVWKNLIRFLASDLDEEAEAAARCLQSLTSGGEEQGQNQKWKAAYDNGIVPAVTRVLKGNIGEMVKIETMLVLLNMLQATEVKHQLNSIGGIPVITKLLRSNNNALVQLTGRCLREMARVEAFAVIVAQSGAIPDLIKAMERFREPEVLVELVEVIANLVEENTNHQQALGSLTGAVHTLISLFEGEVNSSLLLALTSCISKATRQNEDSQVLFCNEGVAVYLINLTDYREKEVQLRAVETIQTLAKENPTTQKILTDAGVVSPLMQMMQKTRQEVVLVRTAGALWALAGNDVEQRSSMAAMMGVQQLVDFLNSAMEDLHLIGCEALSVLSQGALGKHTAIYQANGVHPCVRLLRSDREDIVISAIRTLRYLSVSVAYVPHRPNQTIIAQSRGIKFLVALMVHSKDEMIQVEAAFALASVALGNIIVVIMPMERYHSN